MTEPRAGGVACDKPPSAFNGYCTRCGKRIAWMTTNNGTMVHAPAPVKT